jgi:hypothetical protein
MSESWQSRLHNKIYMSRYNDRNVSSAAKRFLLVKRLLIGLGVVGALVVMTSTQVQSVLEALRAPVLPELQVVDRQGNPLAQHWPAQNWGGTTSQVSENTKKYHHITQGTATLPIPYAWFIHLEQPDSSLWATLLKSIFFIESGRMTRDGYLLRFGFIRSTQHPVFNPDGLPIGFAKSESINIPGFATKTAGVGFTCAACHTGHIVHDQGGKATEYIIEGGPATTDLSQLVAALGAAMGQTAVSSKLPFFDGRFDRFARNVLGTQYNAVGKAALAENLVTTIEALKKAVDIVDVQEGFTRLDALNRIGNQVFAKNVDRHDNYQPINAPVNYPFIWTTSWFKWVQYDASIMRPLVRNAGEAMGVTAHVSMYTPKDENRFQSSIPMEHLFWIEDFLKGKAFNEGLTAPAWPFKPVEKTSAKYQQGEALYKERCEGCHLPVVDNPALAKHLKPIEYLQVTKNSPTPVANSTSEKVLDLHVIPQSEIGTDPAQGNVLATRTVNTAGSTKGTIEQATKGLGIDRTVCGQNPEQVYKNALSGEKKPGDLLNGVPVSDGRAVNFGLALGALVQQSIDAWFTTNGVSDAELKDRFQGGRPNCLQAGQGYKARPLNGVWATAPFLHNGSVATLHDLLCKPQEKRPPYIRLGDIRFDADNVGLQQPKDFAEVAARYVKKKRLYTAEGYFILDTTIPGNSNLGHSFSDEYDAKKRHSEQKKGVIGPGFTGEQCDALIDYLKTI